jgi:hypothetical protein
MSRFGARVAGLWVASGLALACGDDSSSDAGSPDAGSAGSGMGGNALSFAADIHPILLAKCSGANGCHSTANPFLPGHAQPDVADAYDATQSMSTLGGPVYARILIRGSGSGSAGFMPPSCSGPVGSEGCLTEEELELIEAWVAADAPP